VFHSLGDRNDNLRAITKRGVSLNDPSYAPSRIRKAHLITDYLADKWTCRRERLLQLLDVTSSLVGRSLSSIDPERKDCCDVCHSAVREEKLLSYDAAALLPPIHLALQATQSPISRAKLVRLLRGLREPATIVPVGDPTGFGVFSAFSENQLTRCVIRLLALGLLVEACVSGTVVISVPVSSPPSALAESSRPGLCSRLPLQRIGDPALPTIFNMQITEATRASPTTQAAVTPVDLAPIIQPTLVDLKQLGPFWSRLLERDKAKHWTIDNFSLLHAWALAWPMPKVSMTKLGSVLTLHGIHSLTGDKTVLFGRLIKGNVLPTPDVLSSLR